MKKLVLLMAGALLGALSWLLATTVSGKFEPFDSESGFLVTQIILSGASLVVGLKRGMVDCIILVFGAHLGMNALTFAFGGSESRAWAMLGLITTVALVIYPVLAGLIGAAAVAALTKFRQRKAGP